MTTNLSYQKSVTTTTAKTVPYNEYVAVYNGNVCVDITQVVTLDAGGTAEKTMFRIVIPINISGQAFSVAPSIYTFPGSAPSYASGGNTPDLATYGVAGSSIQNMTAFLAAAGDVTG